MKAKNHRSHWVECYVLRAEMQRPASRSYRYACSSRSCLGATIEPVERLTSHVHVRSCICCVSVPNSQYATRSHFRHPQPHQVIFVPHFPSLRAAFRFASRRTSRTRRSDSHARPEAYIYYSGPALTSRTSSLRMTIVHRRILLLCSVHDHMG
jgi:hypothetical protein